MLVDFGKCKMVDMLLVSSSKLVKLVNSGNVV